MIPQVCHMIRYVARMRFKGMGAVLGSINAATGPERDRMAFTVGFMQAVSPADPHDLH